MRALLDATMDRLKGPVGALAAAIVEVAAWFAPGLPIPVPQLVVAAQLLRWVHKYRDVWVYVCLYVCTCVRVYVCMCV